jgi:hypothetical protein
MRALALAAILALAACGPIEYVNTVTRGADSAVAEARAANAAKWSPYYWTRAVEYLRLARIEAASADFQAANRFGRLSEEAAIKARDEALHCAAAPDETKCSHEPIGGPIKRDDDSGLAPLEGDE